MSHDQQIPSPTSLPLVTQLHPCSSHALLLPGLTGTLSRPSPLPTHARPTHRAVALCLWHHGTQRVGAHLSPPVACAPLPRSPQSFEALNPRAVSVVIDPVQSVKGKVVIDAFRLISPQVGPAPA